mgnify:FL=1
MKRQSHKTEKGILMTKTLPYLAVTCALGLLLTSCSQSSQGSSRVTPSAAPDATMTPSGNVSKDLDVKTKVIKGAGLAITVDKSKQQVTFQTVDPKTKKPMKDWYMFNEKAQKLSWHKWVSAMGQAFDYTFSLTTHKMTKIKDFHHNDITPQVKQMGFWKPAQDSTSDAEKRLAKYFKNRYGMTIRQAASA